MIDIVLKSKEVSFPIKYNGYYKLILMLAIIKYCGRGGKASITLIHLIFWSIKSKDNYIVIMDIKKQIRSNLVPWSFEIGIEKILSLAYVNDFCDKKISSGEIELSLTEHGNKVLSEIVKEELFVEEIDKIKAIGQIPKNRIKIANSNWKLI
jgi:hypothetical protein